jgi:hypothetical protein
VANHDETENAVNPGGIGTLLLFTLALRAADTLPKQIADEEFWKLSDSMSEANGEFQSENLLSNETGFQVAIPVLKQFVKPDGVYFGVGPEQNFTYIAALRPKMAFIIDIRRQNMVEHMMYKGSLRIIFGPSGICVAALLQETSCRV